MLTECSHDLRLQSVLALEISSKVADSATTISGDIRHFANMVEHVAAGKEKDGDQADGCPEIAVLDDGKHIWPGSSSDGNRSSDKAEASSPSHPVNGSLHGRVGSVGQLSRQPRVNLLCGGWTIVFVSRARSQLGRGFAAHPPEKSYRIGSGEIAA